MDNKILVLIVIIFYIVLLALSRWRQYKQREQRRNHYRNEYLKSDDWQRKRYVVFKRDNWKCVFCGAPATQVHHKKYLGKNIGKEPIEWLVSVCDPCHQSLHKY